MLTFVKISLHINKLLFDIRIVIPVVVGSSPIIHPNQINSLEKITLGFFYVLGTVGQS